MLARLERRLPALCGSEANDVFVSTQYRFELLRPDAVAVGTSGSGVAFLDGFNIVQPKSAPPRAGRLQLLARVAYEASFFRRYWVVVAGQGKIAEGLVKDIHARLGLTNVGVAIWGEGGPEVLAEADWGAPVPDRRALAMNEVWRQGERRGPGQGKGAPRP